MSRRGRAHLSGGALPASLDAERAILGAVLLDNSKHREALAARLIPDDFSLEAHHCIYSAIGDLIERGTAADIITISEELRQQQQLESIGGVAYLASLTDGVSSRTSILHYVNILREKAALRQAIRLAEAVQHAASGPSADVSEIAQRLSDGGRDLAALAAPSSRISTLADIPDVHAVTREPVAWAVEGLLPLHGVAAIAGPAGVGKSFLALALARSIVTGGEFLGRACAEQTVLYCDRENSSNLVRNRLDVLFGGPPVGLKTWGGWCADEPPLIGDARLLEFAATGLLIVFDSFVRFHTADENSATEMRAVMAHLRALANAGATVLLIHHKSKAEGSQYRGSSDIAAGVDTLATLSKADKGLLELRIVKHRQGAEFAVTVNADFEHGTFEAVESLAAAERDDDVSTISAAIAATPGISQAEISKVVGMRKQRLVDVLRDHDGWRWRAEGGPNRSLRYYPVVPQAREQSGNNGNGLVVPCSLPLVGEQGNTPRGAVASGKWQCVGGQRGPLEVTGRPHLEKDSPLPVLAR